MEKKSIKKNYIYNMIYQLLLIITPIITTPFLARKLESSGNGVFGFTISIVTYFILFGSMGTSLYAQREIAYNQNKKKNLTTIFWEILLIRVVLLSFSAVVFYVLFCRNGDYSTYYNILILEIIANAIDISWLYQGLENFKRIAIRNFIIKLISMTCIFIFIRTPNDLYKYFLIYCLSTLFGSCSLWLGVKKYIGKPKITSIKNHFRPIIMLFIPQVAIHIYTVLDRTMIGYLTNDMREVGYYDQSQKIIRLLLTILTSVGTVMLPRISACFSEGNDKLIKIYLKKSFSFTLMVSIPLMFGVLVTSHIFSPLFFGEGYDKVPIIMNITSIIVLFISLASVTGTQYLLPLKKQKEYTISVVTGAVINIILNFILIKYLKSYGAAIATVFAEFSVTFLQFYFVRKNIKITEILKLSKNYFISALCMVLFCLIIGKIIDNSMISLIIQISFGIIIYFTILMLMKDDFLIDLVNSTIFKKIKRKTNSNL